MLSKNQFELLEKIEVNEIFTGKQAEKLTGKKSNSLGGILSGLYRAGYVEPVYREFLKENNKWRRLVTWKRVK